MPKVLVILIVLSAVLLVACNTAPPASDIVVREAWVRAAAGVVETAEEHSSEGMTGMAMGDTDATATPTEEAAPMGGMDMGMNGPVSAAYMLIENRGGAADRLLRASTDAAAVVEIHETQIDDQGVGQMRPLAEGLEIPANGSVRLEPGGYHVMLMDLRRDLVAGEMVRLTLTFESGKEITVEAEIRQP